MRWRVFLQIQQFQRISSYIQQSLHSGLLRNIKMPYYAVARGRSVGIYETWADCEAQVKGFSGARYKKFDSSNAAQDFILTNGGSTGSAPSNSNDHNYKVQNHAGPSNNLKRTYSTSSNNKNDYNKSSKSSKSTREQSNSEESDDSDDLNDIIMKQMDDIEHRMSSFSKGIDKIVNKSVGKSSGRKAIMVEPPEPKKRKSNDKGFEEDVEGYVQVYTDGACSQNGRKGARAGLGVYWGENHAMNTSQPVSGRATNNCGEIQAATHAIRQAIDTGITKLSINTDSKFLINSVTKWLPGWKRKGWKLASGEPVKNEKDFKDLDSVQNRLQIKWNYVEAHKGIHGNERADELARAGATMYDK